MIFFESKAREYAHGRVDELANGQPSDKMLFAAANKIGIDKVVAELGDKGGAIELNFNRSGRYVLDIDDIRRCIHSLRSATQAAERDILRPSFA